MHRLLLTIFLLALPLSAAFAQSGHTGADVVPHAQNIAQNCPHQWESQPCLKAVSESALAMISHYAAKLDAGGKKSVTETLKQHCAAATAASKGEYPAYAMRSAYTECANTISDLAEGTGISPDLSHYQLLVMPVLCLNNDKACAGLEQQLLQYK